MGGPVRINGREVVTSKSGGVSFASGDVCKVPDGGGPVPFVNVAVSADAANTSRTVRVHGVPVVLARSTFARSTGDEPGKDGGVVSGTQQGAAMFCNYSFDVRIEGQPVPRALDPMLHNMDADGVPNAVSPAELQAVGSEDPEKDIVCHALCYCMEAEMRMDCFRALLATPVQDWIPTCDIDPDAPPGHKSCVRYWDPHNPPGFYVEPTYQMIPPPPTPMLGMVRSATMKGANGDPLPLPGGDSPVIHGSRRPDVVVPLDPTKPPGPGNIKRIFEVKFPGDRRRWDQEVAYREIAAPNGRLDVITAEDCDCQGRHRPNPQEVPVPVPDPRPKRDPQSQEEPNQEPDPGPGVPAPDPGAVGVGAVLLMLLKKAGDALKSIPKGAPVFGPLPPITPGLPGPPGSDGPQA
jgi:hypothetical protein